MQQTRFLSKSACYARVVKLRHNTNFISIVNTQYYDITNLIYIHSLFYCISFLIFFLEVIFLIIFYFLKTFIFVFAFFLKIISSSWLSLIYFHFIFRILPNFLLFLSLSIYFLLFCFNFFLLSIFVYPFLKFLYLFLSIAYTLITYIWRVKIAMTTVDMEISEIHSLELGMFEERHADSKLFLVHMNKLNIWRVLQNF